MAVWFLHLSPFASAPLPSLADDGFDDLIDTLESDMRYFDLDPPQLFDAPHGNPGIHGRGGSVDESRILSPATQSESDQLRKYGTITDPPSQGISLENLHNHQPVSKSQRSVLAHQLHSHQLPREDIKIEFNLSDDDEFDIPDDDDDDEFHLSDDDDEFDTSLMPDSPPASSPGLPRSMADASRRVLSAGRQSVQSLMDTRGKEVVKAMKASGNEIIDSAVAGAKSMLYNGTVLALESAPSIASMLLDAARSASATISSAAKSAVDSSFPSSLAGRKSLALAEDGNSNSKSLDEWTPDESEWDEIRAIFDQLITFDMDPLDPQIESSIENM
ncbi:MAG: hypothetical protein SGCHY_003571 [Lobulomycetales sp.]